MIDFNPLMEKAETLSLLIQGLMHERATLQARIDKLDREIAEKNSEGRALYRFLEHNGYRPGEFSDSGWVTPDEGYLR